MTTKMQREVYQGKVNEIFRRQLAYHLEEKTEEVTELESEAVDDFTARDEDDFEDECTLDYQALDQSSWCVFQDNQYHSIMNLKELPGYEKLLLHKATPELVTDSLSDSLLEDLWLRKECFLSMPLSRVLSSPEQTESISDSLL